MTKSSKSKYKVTLCHEEYEKIPCPFYAPHLNKQSLKHIHKFHEQRIKFESDKRKLVAVDSNMDGKEVFRIIEEIALCIDVKKPYIEGNCDELIDKYFPNWKLQKESKVSISKDDELENRKRFDYQAMQDYYWESPFSSSITTRRSQMQRLWAAKYLEIEIQNYFKNEKIKSKPPPSFFFVAFS